MSYSLYEISQDAKALDQLIMEDAAENEGCIDDQLIQWEHEIGDNLERKAEAYCSLIRSKEALAKQLREEEKEFAQRRKSIDNTVARMKDRMKMCLELADKKEVVAGVFKVAIQNNAPRVDVEDIDRIHPDYKTASLVIPFVDCPHYLREIAEIQVTKKPLTDALKEGAQIEGCSLVRDTRLAIRIAS